MFESKHVGVSRFGIMDHDVTLAEGTAIHNPFRVTPNGAGSEVIFTVFRQPGDDVRHVQKDLLKLKEILE